MFDNILLKNIEKLDEIKFIKNHQIVYLSTFTIFLILITAFIVILIFTRKEIH